MLPGSILTGMFPGSFCKLIFNRLEKVSGVWVKIPDVLQAGTVTLTVEKHIDGFCRE
jgi:hypothetical protein